MLSRVMDAASFARFHVKWEELGYETDEKGSLQLSPSGKRIAHRPTWILPNFTGAVDRGERAVDRNIKQYQPVVKDEDLKQPLAWIKSCTYEELHQWLAYAIWSGDTLPLVEPVATDFISQLVRLVMKEESAELRQQFWRIVPILLRSWARGDPARCLDDLLILAARLRCATAAPDIMLIIRERLEGHADEISLRQHCLRALAGLGPTENSLPLFRDYIQKQEYAPAL
jgi:hypothetical protein